MTYATILPRTIVLTLSWQSRPSFSQPRQPGTSAPCAAPLLLLLYRQTDRPRRETYFYCISRSNPDHQSSCSTFNFKPVSQNKCNVKVERFAVAVGIPHGRVDLHSQTADRALLLVLSQCAAALASCYTSKLNSAREA